MNMYEVCAKCGHVGRNYYIERVFAVKAESGKEASAIVRQMPRVKHHLKDAIIYVLKIDKIRYDEIRDLNNKDPYMHCRNIQEQRMNCSIDIKRETLKCVESRRKEEKEKRKQYYHKKELRNPKKYINKYVALEEYVS